MSFPRMSLHIGDYKKDTGHLRAAGHGAYLLLIMHYWATGGLPDDDKQLASIACLSDKEWKYWKPILRPFFIDGWRHKRIDKEYAEAEVKYQKRAEAGKLGGKAKANAKQNPSNATAKTYQPITDTPTEEIEGDARAREPLISKEAIEVSKTVLKAIGADQETPDWCGFPYIVQTWIAEKIPKDFIISTCANLPGKHRNYLNKAVTNGWRDKQLDQQNPTKRAVTNGPSTGNIMPAIDSLIERVRDFDRPPAICGAAGEAPVRLLPEGRCERPGDVHSGGDGDSGGLFPGGDPARH